MESDPFAENPVFRLLVDRCTEFVGACDRDGVWRYVNPYGLSLVGLPPERLSDTSLGDLLFPEDRDRVLGDLLPRALREERGEVELRLRHVQTGEPVPVRCGVTPLADPSGFAIVCRDIADLQRLEQALHESEGRVRRFFDTNPIGVAEVRPIDGRVVWANDAFLEVIGYTREDLEAGRINRHGITPPEWVATDQERIAEVRRNGSCLPFEKEYFRKDGTRVPVMVGVTLLYPGRVVAFVMDISARRQAEAALLESEERFHAAVEGLHEGLAILGSGGEFLFCNQSGLRMLGLSHTAELAQLAYDATWRTFHEDGTPLPLASFPIVEALATGQPVHDRVMGVARGDRPVTWMEINAAPLRRPGEEAPFGAVASFADITERKRLEAALRESEERMRLLADNAPAFISNVDTESRYVFVNRSYAERFGLSVDQVVGRTVADVLGEAAYRTVEPFMRRAFAGETFSYEATIDYKHQGQRFMQVSYAPDVAHDGAVRGLIGVIHDVTARRQLEEERERHLEQIAGLNARLRQSMTETHHRVKNNLQVIAAMVDIQTLDDPEQVPLSEFRRLGLHVRTLAAVHDILTEHAKRDSAAEMVSARAILDRLLQMLQGTIGDRPLHYRLEDAPLASRQAGTLALLANELTSNAVKYGRSSVWVTFAVEGESAILSVEDDGPGFPPEFDPAAAARTGLELVLNLVNWDMRGRVRFENRDEGGGRAVVTFPLVAA